MKGRYIYIPITHIVTGQSTLQLVSHIMLASYAAALLPEPSAKSPTVDKGIERFV